MKTAMFSSMFSLAAIIIVFSPIMTAAQTSSADDINIASSFIDRLREIMDIRTQQAQTDPASSIACTNIINDFNGHMTQLFDQEQNELGQLMLGGNQ